MLHYLLVLQRIYIHLHQQTTVFQWPPCSLTWILVHDITPSSSFICTLFLISSLLI
jgi:hypothetical protein